MKIGPKYKIAKRLGEGIFDKTDSPKFHERQSRKKFTTGGKGKRRRNLTEYGRQLKEKQKIKFSYGITEAQLRRYVDKAKTVKGVAPTEALFGMLESRLDSVVYRLGIVNSRQFARQVVSHGHMTVNGRRVNVPSYALRAGDVVGVREASSGSVIFQTAKDKVKDATVPSWIKFDASKMTAELKGEPVVGEIEANLDWRTLMEFYSRV